MTVKLREMFEGMSGKGAEGVGMPADSFEVQNQGVTRGVDTDGTWEGQQCSRCGAMGWWDDALCTNCRREGEVGEGADPAKLGRMKGAVSAMKNAVDVRLKKSSEKEKHEHPWMSGKEAMRVAKDHERLGEQLKRVFVVREADEKRPERSYTKEKGWRNMDKTGREIPDDEFYQGYDDFYAKNEPVHGANTEFEFSRPFWDAGGKRQKIKPPLEKVAGKYMQVSQHAEPGEGVNWNDITDQQYHAMSPMFSDSPGNSWGHATYLIGQDGSLKWIGADYDSSG